MKAVLDNEPNSMECLSLVNFALACGATTFTFTSAAPDLGNLFSPFHIGPRSVQDTNEIRFRSVKREVWRLTAEAISTLTSASDPDLFRGQSKWTFFSSLGAAFLVLEPGAAWLNPSESQWQELFRNGFKFSLIKPDGLIFKEQFTLEDLPENKKRHPLIASRKAKTVAEVLASPWSLRSHAPTYGSRKPDPGALQNEKVSAWWTSSHDEILKAQIRKDGWNWWPSPPDLIAVMDLDIFERWKVEDPECLKLGWANVMIGYARARAVSIGLTANMKWSEDSRECAVCNERFSPKVHHRNIRKATPLFERICHTCIADSYNSSDVTASRETIDTYVQTLGVLLGQIPTLGFGRSHADYGLLTESNFCQVVALLRKRPADARIHTIYGSWFQTLIGAGLLEDGTRRMTRGTQCLAKDGHVCLSLAEKTIDDLLSTLGIPHEKEAPYPEGRFRCDFLAGQTYIEYFGLRGNPEYDIKIDQKIALCNRLGLKLLAIYPEDLLQRTTLEKKLAEVGVRDLLPRDATHLTVVSLRTGE